MDRVRLTKQSVITIWKHSLSNLLRYYERKRRNFAAFFFKLFLFFVGLNIFCYWWAIFTAYPHEIRNEPMHYFLLQFFVGFLGAVFDSISFFVTIWIARRALQTTSTTSYLLHLSVDLVIAVIATGWILLVFTVSGWLVSLLQFQPESLADRTVLYEGRLVSALQNPMANLRNIYFGIIIGISAMLPTFTHMMLSIYAVFKFLFLRSRSD